MKSFFSSHGLKSLSQRFVVSCQNEILQLLDEHRYIPLRQEEHSTRVHKIIWIASIYRYCNVIQDESNGEIITVLYATLTPAKKGVRIRKIGHCVLGRAKRIALNSKPVFDLNTLHSIQVNAPDALLRLSIGITNQQTGYVRELREKISVQKITKPNNLLEDPEIQEVIWKTLHVLAPRSIIEFIVVKVGNSYTSRPLHWFPSITTIT